MNIKQLRNNLNKTQEQVAKDLGMQRSKFSRIETGESDIDTKTLIKLADYFSCSIDYLLCHKTQSILHLDSFTPAQQNIISQIKELDDHELAILEGFLFRLQQEKANPWLKKK